MKALGHHIIAELSGCNKTIISSLVKVRKTMVQAALEAKAEVREIAFHKFSPQGVSGVVVIAESHLAIHTWPEYNYVAIDIYTCGDKTDPLRACQYIANAFECKNMKHTIIDRGISNSKGLFTHNILDKDNALSNKLAGGVLVA